MSELQRYCIQSSEEYPDEKGEWVKAEDAIKRTALLEKVAEVVEKWATAIPADHEKEELWEMEDAIFSALRAAGYLGESK